MSDENKEESVEEIKERLHKERKAKAELFEEVVVEMGEEVDEEWENTPAFDKIVIYIGMIIAAFVLLRLLWRFAEWL